MGFFDKLLNRGARVLADAVEEVYDERTFDEKLKAVLANIGSFELRENLSPNELEAENGEQIYTRSNSHAVPNLISYGIYENGARVLLIRLWDLYTEYDHAANREIKRYCDIHGIKMLDFFDYLPNDAAYMEDRIRKTLG